MKKWTPDGLHGGKMADCSAYDVVSAPVVKRGDCRGSSFGYFGEAGLSGSLLLKISIWLPSGSMTM
jgi:hypothetical protein